MSVQTTYSINMAAAFEGQIAESGPKRIRTGRNNMAATQIGYGRFVAFDGGSGTSDIAIKLPDALANEFKGVLVWQAAHEPQTTGIDPVTGIGDVMEQGTVWMLTEQAVGPADPVFVRVDVSASPTGTSPAVGKVRKDADPTGGLASVDRAVAMTNARFLSTAAAGALVKVQLNLP
jgi:hypothetical protein